MHQTVDGNDESNAVAAVADEDSTVLSEFRASLASFAFSAASEASAVHKATLPSSVSKRASLKRSLTTSDADLELVRDSATDLKVEGLCDGSVTSTPTSSPSKRKRAEPRGSVSPKKKRVEPRGYASPETYAHLRELRDHITEGLDVIFCGINPGQKSAELGHHFAHPTNHFWPCLYESAQEDHTLPERFSLGLTNLVDRPTAEQNELSAAEQSAAVPTLMAKVALYRPRILCFVGLDIAKRVQKELGLPKKVEGTKLGQSKQGLQAYKVVYSDTSGARETLFYALPSTSARVVEFQKPEKVKLFTALKEFLEQVKRGEVNTDAIYAITRP
ncbi:putative uracil DNA glycosylase superfamily protein [Lyophyllum shimeji]|uniref:Uracil DNA glycosylase superfamily protein n=1 Tax=Lyophyllum shimeji TaxID=47721 RepID=A0A9P3PPG5_LYOSH|nr:putative uracil DNA glycosylase superfamily protein [Lyophyllum shimeji]